MKFTRCLLLLLAPSLPAAAHDLWLEREAGAYVLQQGHRTGAHAGAERVPYAAGFVQQALCADAQGRTRPLAVAGGYPARVAGDCAALVVAASSGYWTKTAWETKNAPKAGMAGVLKSWRSEDSVKRLERWSAALAQPLTPGLEITPVGDPFRLGVDDKITVRVTLDRKPRDLGTAEIRRRPAAPRDQRGPRRGQMTNMRAQENGTVLYTYLVPTRGLLGFRYQFLTATRGGGAMEFPLVGIVLAELGLSVPRHAASLGVLRVWDNFLSSTPTRKAAPSLLLPKSKIKMHKSILQTPPQLLHFLI